ncbi:N-acetylmuramoyl-L-alanine amidase [Flavobacterium sp. CS20]|uniref:N-acetylmuramoyl-L-alanine amidase family protein n=1 Tax=Flavobacterium sp. CS20 TaxID=2775246 RepID=UPI001B3A5CF0|nr:N-acetylmuramoyl-L-alanine amidase [Flavobacterium sp. CS20]QTY27723.1 N-acetylmuramoyl-L-alanine amidase [Flavobacterium sp. CS20]
MNRLQKLKLKLQSDFKINLLQKHLAFAFIVILSVFNNFQIQAQSQQLFKVVIDAGHGGKDTGTHGYGVYEKDVVLDVVLKVGAKLRQHKDIELIYTRQKDEFIGLNERAVIGNKAKADLFVSIHCNGVRSDSPYGSETFVLGLHRNQDNLEVAMKENQVIELEENYEEKYGGFDPKTPESYIGFSLMQEEYLDQSILLADYIQKNFTQNLKRKNRGVKQAGFLVLRETYMPSVLVELGFLSNKSENNFLKSEKGQMHLAEQISQAIINYKNALHIESEEELVASSDVQKNKDTSDEYKATFYVQIVATKRKIKASSENFKGLSPISRVKEGDLYKYRFAESHSHKYIQNKLLEAKDKGYKGAFIIAYLGDKKISIEQALKTQIK